MNNKIALTFALYIFLNKIIIGQSIILRTAAQESHPKYVTKIDGSIGGIAVDVMRAIEEFDSEIIFIGDQNYMPFIRIQNEVENGRLDVFLGLLKMKIGKKGMYI